MKNKQENLYKQILELYKSDISAGRELLYSSMPYIMKFSPFLRECVKRGLSKDDALSEAFMCLDKVLCSSKSDSYKIKYLWIYAKRYNVPTWDKIESFMNYSDESLEWLEKDFDFYDVDLWYFYQQKIISDIAYQSMELKKEWYGLKDIAVILWVSNRTLSRHYNYAKKQIRSFILDKQNANYS